MGWSGKLAQTKHDDNQRLEHRMAAIWKRGKAWRVEIRRLNQPKQNRTFDTKAKAEAWARQVESKMDRGEFVDLKEAERNTLGDLLLRYSEKISPRKKGGDLEIVRIRKLRSDPIALFKVSELRSKHVADYRDRRLAGDSKTKPVSGSTVNRDLNLLRTVQVYVFQPSTSTSVLDRYVRSPSACTRRGARAC
jgi:hypothetical protein